MSLKKNLLQQYRNEPETDFYFFDESRFGTHSKIGHGWFNKGERPLVQMKLGFQNFYVYSAVHAHNGDEFSLMMPKLNTDCMNIFLNELVKYTKGKTVAIIMDQAAWHKSKDLVIPDTVKIILLPPYSPELNPVERLWLYMKSKLIKNKIYDSIETLKTAVTRFLANLQSKIVKNICSVNYLGS
jgi:putative transposase